MPFEPRELGGLMFSNQNKTHPNAPDLSGECLVNGVKHTIAAWRKTAKNGNEYLSWEIKPERRAQGANRRSEYDDSGIPLSKEDDDSIPF